jgi:hypothetical protein
MMLVIQTQDYENYAAHRGFTGEFYWKAKGGSEFKVVGVPADLDPAEVVDLVRDQIEEDTPYFQTTITGYSVESDDYLSWFEKSQLEYDGSIQYPEPRIEYAEVRALYTDPREYAERSADLDAQHYAG